MKKQNLLSKAMNPKRNAMIISFILLFIFYSLSSVAQGKDNWVLKKNMNDINVWTRIEPNSGLPEYKAATKIEAPISSLLEVLLDVEAYPNLFIGTKSAKLLKKESDTQICYMHNECPFPFSDRDGIYSSTIDRNPVNGMIRISIVALPDYKPKHSNRVRIPVSVGYWTLKPLHDGTVEVVYQQYADPGGSFPLWIIKLYSVNIPFKTLNNLRSQVQLPKYQNNFDSNFITYTK